MTSGILIIKEDMLQRLDLEDKIQKTGDFEMSRKGFMGNPLPLIGDPIHRLLGRVKNEAKKYGSQVVVIKGEEHTTGGFIHQYTAKGYYGKFLPDIDEPLLAEEVHDYWPNNLISYYVKNPSQ